LNIVQLLKETGAMKEGHFLLSSGRHSDQYFQCAQLFMNPDKAKLGISVVRDAILKDVQKGVFGIDAVVGPAMGGIIAAYELGSQLGLPAFFTERNDEGKMTLRRGFTVFEGQRILIAEDVITTGKSSAETAAVLESHGAQIVALACVVDRRTDEIHLKWPIYSAVKVEAISWDPCDCSLCKKNIPIDKPGSRKISEK
jgi:orotate phosphoribosyltransferase